jgi:hypothetical protein
MESLGSTLALLFQQRLRLGKPQWYCLDVDSRDVGGLSLLLNATSEAYQAMVLKMGWIKQKKGRYGVSLSIQPTVIDSSFRSHTIPAEVLQAKVAGVVVTYLTSSILLHPKGERNTRLSIGCRMPILEPVVDFDPDRYQVLQKLGAPIDCLFLWHVVQEILQLEEDTKASILSLVKTKNGK